MIAPLVMNRGTIHDYLGMTLDFSVKGKVQLTMMSYIKNMLAELAADMDGVASTPAAEDLFQVNLKLVMLDQETTKLFHHNVAKPPVPLQACMTRYSDHSGLFESTSPMPWHQ